MEPDDGHERARFSADFIPVLILPEIFHCRYDGWIGKELSVTITIKLCANGPF